MVSVVCWAFLLTSYSASINAQVDSTTGSLTNFTGTPTDTTSVWNNAGSVGLPLTCWSGGDPGYCGSNPRVSAWGAGSNVINFSYGQVDLNQVVNINKALAIGGSGVQLSGFNFGFTAKNGNGWDNGQQDYLSAYVKFYSSSGSQVAAYDYTSQTNRKYNWTQFNFSETFATPYTASSLGNAQYGFVGRDTNYWVGPYGPEIMNVNFSLKYTVKPDPCISDPLSSPTCPGYALATVKNSILGSTVAGASVTSYIPTTNLQPAPAAAPPAVADAAPALAQTSPTQQAQQPAQPSPAPAPATDQNPSVAQDNPAQPSPQQQGPAPTSPQPAGGPPQTVTASTPPPSTGPQQIGPSTNGGSGPGKLAMSVVKSAQANDKATQQMAVQNAAKAIDATVQSSNAASNAAVSMNQDLSANSATAAAQFSSQSTQASMQSMVQSTQTQLTTQQVSSVQSQGSKATQTNQQTTSGTGLTANSNPFAYNPFGSINASNSASAPSQTAPVYQPKLQEHVVESDTPQAQVAGFGGTGKPGNPLSEMMMQQRFELMQENIQQQTSTVNRTVQPNELAMGVDLASMTLQPKGFEAYSFVLRDAAFYEPKEVYRGQTVVDNVRVLRQMSSDRLHKQMVDSQYKLGE